MNLMVNLGKSVTADSWWNRKLVGAEVGCGGSGPKGAGLRFPVMANILLMAKARKRVREAQAKAQEQRARQERENVEDAAAFVVACSRVAGVDAWEAERIAQINAEAERRRGGQRQAAAAALARMHERGEKIENIAALAETTESEVRSYLKLARTRRPNASIAESHVPGMRMTVEVRGTVGDSEAVCAGA